MDTDRHQRLRPGAIYPTAAGSSSSSLRPRLHAPHFGQPAAPPTLPTQSTPSTLSALLGSSDDPADIVKTSALPALQQPARNMSFAVMALIVVASLCAVVGAIYLLIYFKSIKPMSARSRSYKDSGGGAKGDDDGSRSKSAHPFFRHK
jgi:hypothetical protein